MVLLHTLLLSYAALARQGGAFQVGDRQMLTLWYRVLIPIILLKRCTHLYTIALNLFGILCRLTRYDEFPLSDYLPVRFLISYLSPELNVNISVNQTNAEVKTYKNNPSLSQTTLSGSSSTALMSKAFLAILTNPKSALLLFLKQK